MPAMVSGSNPHPVDRGLPSQGRGVVAAIDCGTSSVKAGIIDFSGRLLGYARKECPVLRLPQGWVEADPTVLRDLTLATLREAVERSHCAPGDIAGISVTGQRASFVSLEESGAPLGNAILWQDSRGAEEIGLLEDRFGAGEFRIQTGLPLNPVFTVGKLMWLLRHDPERAKKMWRVATLPDYILWKMGGDELVTDHANASLTGMLDLARRVWSEPILAAAEIPSTLLPRLVAPGTVVGALAGTVAGRVGLRAGIPLVAGAGDQQCAGLGAGVLENGVVELALGTCGVPLMTVNRLPAKAVAGLMCCCHAAPDLWEVEGFQNSAGAALAWGEQLLASSESATVGAGFLPPGAHGILFLPYLCGGSSAPHWNPKATGTFLGLTLGHTSADLQRAILEGVLIESGNVLDLMADQEAPIQEIRVTGGCARHPLVPRLLAGITGLPVRVTEHHETGLVGAALLAALGIGGFSTLEAATAAMVRLGDLVTASRTESEAGAALRDRYRSVVAALETGRIFSL